MRNQRERLLTQLSKYSGLKYNDRTKINDNTRIYHDLGMGGDDAFEFFDSISAEFKIDFSEMKFSDYFPDETESFFEHIGRLIGFKSKRKSLTVDHLLHVVESGHWYEPNRDEEAG